MGNNQSSKNIENLFVKNQDIYAFSTQESSHNIIKLIKKIFIGYITISNVVLLDIRLIVIVKINHFSKISKIEHSTKPTGFLNIIGNKGGCSISFKFNDTSICFVGTFIFSNYRMSFGSSWYYYIF
jgi:hypothetical protein